MAELRTALAAVLGVGLGVLVVAYPQFVLRVHTVGRVPHDRHGDLGDEGERSAWLLRAVRAVGVALVLAGLYFGYTFVG